MRIFVNQVPFEGIVLEEEISPGSLDLDTEMVSFHSPLKVRAQASRIGNVISVDLDMKAQILLKCSRCLNEFENKLVKKTQLNYPFDNSSTYIDLDPDIREEIIMDYPIKPLCAKECKGLCVKCGKNLNEGGCNCGST
ncbi:MAG: DUF177 domain-containing protein [Candidatus Omnitrophota bacterium]